MSGETIYVASSWKNERLDSVMASLEKGGYGCYDFREAGGTGFHWSEVMPYEGDSGTWGPIPFEDYDKALKQTRTLQGFQHDYEAMFECDACVLVLPSGRSAHLEAGWFIGRRKPTFILLEDKVDPPELMYLLASDIVVNEEDLVEAMKEEMG